MANSEHGDQYNCSQVGAINRIKEAIYGNGKEGIKAIVQRLSLETDTMKNDTETIKNDVKVLLRFQVQTNTKEEQQRIFAADMEETSKVASNKQRWIIGLVITTLLTIVGLIITVISLILKI
jgi:hypothetical protein